MSDPRYSYFVSYASDDRELFLLKLAERFTGNGVVEGVDS